MLVHVHRIEPNAQFGCGVPRSLKNIAYSLFVEETTQLRENFTYVITCPGKTCHTALCRLKEYDSKKPILTFSFQVP